MLAFLQDDETTRCAAAERAFLETVEGGCQVPVGVYAVPADGGVEVEAVIASLDGKRRFRDKVKGEWNDAEALGHQLANRLLDAGGIEILHEIGLLLDRK